MTIRQARTKVFNQLFAWRTVAEIHLLRGTIKQCHLLHFGSVFQLNCDIAGKNSWPNNGGSSGAV